MRATFLVIACACLGRSAALRFPQTTASRCGRGALSAAEDRADDDLAPRRVRGAAVAALAAAIVAAPVLALRPALAAAPVRGATALDLAVPAAAARVQATTILAFRFLDKEGQAEANAAFLDKYPKAIALESLIALAIFALAKAGVGPLGEKFRDD